METNTAEAAAFGGDKGVRWIRRRVVGLTGAVWDPAEELDTLCRQFFARGGVVCFHSSAVRQQQRRTVVGSASVPDVGDLPADAKLVYFFAPAAAAAAEADPTKAVVWGECAAADAISTLLALMGGVFRHELSGGVAQTWPESTRREFRAGWHRFMASLTETAHIARGRTVLYVPDDDEGGDLAAASGGGARAKDLLQLMEGALINWTRQIKEAIANQESAELADNAGPLAELAFWQTKAENLSSIRDQLAAPRVRQIVAALRDAKSSYVEPFEALSDAIRAGSLEAQDNLRFLSLLRAPCEALAQAEPRAVPPLLPRILHTVRYIAAHSTHYRSAERVAGLLTKISNEIMARCQAKIKLSDVLDPQGDVGAGSRDLGDSIAAMKSWRMAFAAEKAVIALAAAKAAKKKEEAAPWDFSETGVFAYLDAFAKRCRDLLEVCEGQAQFARRRGSGRVRAPSFGGSGGPDVMKGLAEVERAFERQLAQLRALDYSPLDVKATRWHDDFGLFVKACRDMELMLVNLINAAFDSAPTVASGVHIVALFRGLVLRPSNSSISSGGGVVQRALERKAAEVIGRFLAELGRVKEAFEHGRKSPPVAREHPPVAGAALWAISLAGYVDALWAQLPQSFAHGQQATLLDAWREAEAEHEKLVSALREYVAKVHSRWTELAESSVPVLQESLAKNPVIARNQDTGLLECSFPADAIVLFDEVYWWKQLGMGVPEAAEQLYATRLGLLRSREAVAEVVRKCNAVTRRLGAEESELFHERVAALHATVLPAVETLAWNQSSALEDFARAAGETADDVGAHLAQFKLGSERASAHASAIATLQLFGVRKQATYRADDFVAKQNAHRTKAISTLEGVLAEIASDVRLCRESFANSDGSAPADVDASWKSFVKKIDEAVGSGVLHAVRSSLREFERAITGSESSTSTTTTEDAAAALAAAGEKQPLIQVSAGLGSSGVEFTPATDELVAMLTSQARDIVAIAATVKRLCTDEAASCDVSFGDLVSVDSEVVALLHGVESAAHAPLHAAAEYAAQWNKDYRALWAGDKDAFIQAYNSPPQSLERFEEDIKRYQDLTTEIERAEGVTPVGFMLVDCSSLKVALIGHCSQWQGKLTGLLGQLASDELHALHELFDENSRRLKAPPRNLEMLKASTDLLKQLQEGLPRIEARFEPLDAKYKSLQQHEIQIDPSEQALRDALAPSFATFRQTLVEAEGMLKQKREKFKTDLVRQAKEFASTVTKAREELTQKGPTTTAGMPAEKAFRLIAEFRSHMDRIVEKDAQIRSGLEMFQMDAPPNKELAAMQKDLELLDQVWKLFDEWERTWEQWRTIRFSDLEVAKMEEEARRFQKRLVKLGKDAKGMEVWATLKERVDQFAVGMPLITDLKNPAMRPRHWERLREEVGKPFDPTSPMFTLDAVFSLGLDNYAEAIGNISLAATKELAIEQSLKDIEAKWAELNLEIVPHKDTGHHKLHSADDVFQALEDHKVVLSDMKGSRYFVAFEAQAERWEKTLSHVLETLEMILKVQRLWIYLENIFMATEDIRKQLPSESSIFEKVDHAWKVVMDKLARDPNALRGTHTENLLESLIDMDTKLEKVQHSLNQYLESKRRMFPRFYFISDRDLLEILGQTRDPTAVQKHLIKLFDNINQLEFVLSKDKKKHEAVKMISSEGEEVPFAQPVLCEGGIESWLQVLETQMQRTLNRELYQALLGFAKFRKDKPAKQERYLKTTPGQLILMASEIMWTQSCTQALVEIEAGSNRGALNDMRKRQAAMLRVLSDMVRSQLPPLSRIKLVALLTIEIHHRDIIERLIHDGVTSEKDFGWKSQLRFYWEKEEEEAYARQTDFSFQYGYEYIGNTGRLVITPLTDRVYLSLTTALMLKKGSSPQGPAGTGKTETVKDLAKTLGKQCVVFNASEKVDVPSMARSLAGISQAGAWGCFDEFNRIDTQVLSVVAIQISSILAAIAAGKRRFVFPMFEEIVLKPGSGIFITMNPGYAGRSELPDNLKSLFRPVIMWTPDSSMIAEIMLFSEGFSSTKTLARKIVTLFQLCGQQLSKQDHYDFTLRSIKSVLVASGALKRREPEAPEEILLLRALRDMNLPKFVGEDVQLFLGITAVLFPGIEVPDTSAGPLRQAIEDELREEGLQVHQPLVNKIMQLRQTKQTRHGVMLVGKSASAKTTCWKVLANALTRLCKKERAAGYSPVRTVVVNPKALSVEELYGSYDPKTQEWSEGVLSSVMRACVSDTKPEEKWIVFDGLVDTLWVESLNSVLDDSKVLTLVNGDRIFLNPMTSLLFEVEDLRQASPATVSRCGMVYMEENTIGWKVFVESWIQRQPDPECKDHLRMLFGKFVQQTLEFKARECSELVQVSDMHAVMSLCNLYEALATPENGVVPTDTDFYLRMVELWFVFSLIWSIGASVTEESRKKMDMFLRELEGQFPRKDTVYDCVVDPQRRGWAMWEERLQQGWRYAPSDPFHKILVPTVDTLRNSFLVSSLVRAKKHVLLVGESGVGKTVTIQGVLGGGPTKDQVTVAPLNLSARTTSRRLQEFLEGYVDKRTQHVFVPRGGKRLVAFIDDLNLPMKDTYGSQPPLELLRQWIDYGFWYDRANATPNNIRDMQLVCAMAPPGGGRNEISPRLLSRFNVINVTFPDDSQIKRIFGTIINQKLQDFEEEVKPLGDLMTQATWEVYQAVTTTLLPTPSHMHYVFNLRDMSKVIQGLLRARPDHFSSAESMVKLWVHEVQRVFGDRLVDEEGRGWFQNLVSEKLVSVFSQTWVKLFRDPKLSPLFTDLVQEDPVYQEQPDIDTVRKALEVYLEEYQVTSPLDLVLFRDAIQHVCRIHRIITQPRGNALLVGLGGSGRQSLCRLAAFVAGFKLFTIDVRKGFRDQDFREKLKELYFQAGIEEKPTVFLFSDTQMLRPSFLEDVASILSSGEVPNLYTNEELGTVCDALKSSLDSSSAATRQFVRTDRDSLYQLLIERARNNIHIVIMMSPVGERFRNSCRNFPAIINNTTIDWFSEWPSDALREVALKLLTVQPQQQQQKQADSSAAAMAEKLASEKHLADALSTVCQGAHSLALTLSARMAAELKRVNHVTPSNFLELLRCYKTLFERKRAHLESEAQKLENGMRKLDDTRVTVAEMGEKLREMQKQGAILQTQCDEALVVIVQQKQEASDKARAIETRATKLAKEEQIILEEKEKARSELDKAMPAFEAAKKALKALDRRDLGEIRTYVTPLPLTAKVMEAVMVLRGAEPTWAEAKKQLADIQFIPQLLNFDIEAVSDATLKRIDKYLLDPDFRPEKVQRESSACMSLCSWVIAVDQCAHVQREVAPKQQALALAAASLEKNQAELEQARIELQAINEKLELLRADHASRVAEKDKLAAEAAETETKINRANRLVDGLASERARWEKLIAKYRQELELLPGNCVIAASFLAYAGPFPHNYRLELMVDNAHSVTKLVAEAHLPCSPDFSVTDFLADRLLVQEWNSRGLPNDEFSTQNGVMVMPPTKWLPRPRWPLIVDPEGQANKWIKATERGRNLRVITAGQEDFMRTIENAISYGLPVLMEDVGAELDPSLDPVLQCRLIKIGSRDVLRLEEGKEVEYNHDFRFYVTTKLSNPAFGPDLTTKMSVVNFAVREQGLQQQLLGHVVMHERRQLEEQKTALVTRIAEAQRTLSELEAKILTLLSSASGSLLDDEVLVTALETAKTTSEDMKQQLEVSVKTEAKIDHARQAFLPCAIRAAVLFFVLKDLAAIDTMYQFSLDSYVALFSRSLAHSPSSEDLAERIKALNEYHTLNFYRSTCRALFEKHKLIFSFQLAVKVLESERKLNKEEYQFFLRGGSGGSRGGSRAASAGGGEGSSNPCSDWLPEETWAHLVALDKLPAFKNFCSSFEQNARDWHDWFMRPEPEIVPLPGEWENRANELEHLLLIRCFRQDRITSAVASFVSSSLGAKFVEPPTFDPSVSLEDSTPITPLLFVLSPGVDPLQNISQLSIARGMGPDALLYHPLGQGQEARALQLIEEGVRDGKWVFLANCHLMVGWMPKLEKVLDEIASRPAGSVSEHFRIWLSSQPHERFPITLLQRSVKITTQPPKGIKQNLLRIFRQSASEPAFSSRQHAAGRRYRKLFFALTYFHAVLLERSKFLSLGWNTMYDFNDSDFGVSELLLSKLLDQYELQAQQLIQQQQQQQQQQTQGQQQQLTEAQAQQAQQLQQLIDDPVPWQALRYIIAEINYGGRVTDRWDMHVLSVYAKRFFCPDILAQQNHRLSSLGTYYVPEDGPLQSFVDYATSLPQLDKPEAFGQHSNADIASQIQEGSFLVSSLLSLQPRTAAPAAAAAASSSAATGSREQRLLAITADLLKRVPAENIDARGVDSARAAEPGGNPLLTVLSQEIGRYNRILSELRASLNNLRSGLLGLVVMSPELEEIADCLFDSRVPPQWKRAYPSLRGLLPWVADLQARVDMFAQWAQGKQPAVFWLGGFTFPTGFLTALLQKYSLKTGVSIDGLTWEFTFMREPATAIREPPQDGAYITGMSLEGAGWDSNSMCLREPNPMELDVQLPVVHFRPVELKRKQAKDPLTVYQCPCYLWPVRDNSNREKPSYMLTIEVASGKEKPDFWTLRGTAVMLSK